MDLTVMLFLVSGLFLGWSLGANDAANVFGTAVGTRMVRFGTAALVCSVFVVLGAVLSGAGAAHTLGTLGSVNALPGSFMAALAAGATVYGMTKAGLPVSTSQSVVGAIIGWNLFSGSVTDGSALLKIILTWVACPILAGFFAIPIFLLTRQFLRWANFHLLRLDRYMRVALILAGAFGSYSLGANNIANVMGVFVDVSPFTNFNVGGWFHVSSVEQLFLLGSLAIAVGVFTYSKRVMLTVGANIMPMSSVSAWVVVIAHSIVLFLFASEGLEHYLAIAGLPTIPLVPVSSSQAVVGAVLGLGLLRGTRDIDWRLIRNISLGWLTTPLISAALCFVALFFLQNVFNQTVFVETRFVFTPPVLEKLRDTTGLQGWNRLADARFESGAALRDAVDDLDGDPKFDASSVRSALEFARLRHLLLSREALAKLDQEWLSEGQRLALAHLAGSTYRHGWQLADALGELSAEWRTLDDKTVNKLHNKGIERKLEYLYRLFQVPG